MFQLRSFGRNACRIFAIFVWTRQTIGENRAMNRFTALAFLLAFMSALAAPVTAGPVKPGDLTTLDNAGLCYPVGSS